MILFYLVVKSPPTKRRQKSLTPEPPGTLHENDSCHLLFTSKCFLFYFSYIDTFMCLLFIVYFYVHFIMNLETKLEMFFFSQNQFISFITF